jgi:hypothetical protein
MYFPWNWEFGWALSKLQNFGGGGWTPQTPPRYATAFVCGCNGSSHLNSQGGHLDNGYPEAFGGATFVGNLQKVCPLLPRKISECPVEWRVSNVERPERESRLTALVVLLFVWRNKRRPLRRISGGILQRIRKELECLLVSIKSVERCGVELSYEYIFNHQKDSLFLFWCNHSHRIEWLVLLIPARPTSTWTSKLRLSVS